MTEQLTYYFPTPLPTVPPNCLMHSQPNQTTGQIDSWCTFPTPTVVQHHSLTQALPSYMRFTGSQVHTFAPIALLITCIVLLAAIFLYLYTRWYLIKQKLNEQHIFLVIKPTKNTLQDPLATEQLFAQLHALVSQQTTWERVLHKKNSLSVELVATKHEGIRYIIHTTSEDAPIIKRTLLSYLPSVEVTEVQDYLPVNKSLFMQLWEQHRLYLVSFGFSRHFAFPLQTQKVLTQHDPIAYLTGMMTKLEADELIALQLILSPLTASSNFVKAYEAENILNHLWHGKDISKLMQTHDLFFFLFLPIQLIGTIIYWTYLILINFIALCLSIASAADRQADAAPQVREKKGFIPSPSQKALFEQVNQKLSQPLFETNFRLLVAAQSEDEVHTRIRGVFSAFASFDNAGYQAILLRKPFFFPLLPQIVRKYLFLYSYFQFSKRVYALVEQTFLSVSELASLYHLPYTATTKTEDLEKVYSKELPAPLSLKQPDTLDIHFAINTYGGRETLIGLTRGERGRHMAIFGTTGAGKSTMMLKMILEDMQHGEGLLLIDSHGDLPLQALSSLPPEREKDLIWIDPDNFDHPLAINLMELTPNLSENEALKEKEFICESIISLFRKVFSDSVSGNPHRIEYILRNTIHTAFTVENATIFTIYDLLTDTAFRNNVTRKLTDKRLQTFWKSEFSRASSWQQVKMIAPVTARIGRFLFSPSAKRILEQPKSSINFDEILDQQKIVLCRFAQGELGEDTAQIFGMMILNKIQLAALKRARKDESDRKDFYVYVDEFQHFATNSFMQMLSQTRKYRVNLIVSEQTTAQQKDKTLTNILLANTGTIVAFKLASPQDEAFLYEQFSPTVEKGALANLPAYHFYMKKGALLPEDPFSGVTIPVDTNLNRARIASLIEKSNSHFYASNPKAQKKKVTKRNSATMKQKTKKEVQKIDYPDEREE